MTPEQKQRVEQIRERQEHNKSAANDQPVPKFLATAYSDIDFLLSLVSQEAEDKNADDLAEGLTSQLFEVEGFGNYTNTQQREGVFDLARMALRIGINNATASMRSACVEKVGRMAEQWLGDSRRESSIVRANEFYERCCAAHVIAKELESLSIQGREK